MRSVVVTGAGPLGAHRYGVPDLVDLQSPSLLAAAWLLGPALIALACLGLGLGLARLTRIELGALTLPAGFVAGITLGTALLKAGLNGTVVSIVCALAALAGLVAAARAGDLRGRPSASTLWAAGGAIAAFAIAMAPLVGSGRSGIVGYVFNNDPAVHIAVTELLKDSGVNASLPLSSYASMADLLTGGYPLGSYVWPLFASVTTGVEPFHVWTPAIAVASAMLALVTFGALRLLRAPPALAGIAAPVVASGYLTYSFVAQGGAKEVVTAVTVYVTIALAVHTLRSGAVWRALPAPALGAAAALASFGIGALAWIGLPAAVVAAWLVWRLRDRPPRPRTLALAGAGLALLTAAMLPTLLDTIDFVQAGDATLRNPAQLGNLLGPVPWQEALNVWISLDYRLDPPSYQTLTTLGTWLAGVLAVVGLAFALRRRGVVIWLVVLAGVTGAIVISTRYSAYLDAKSYMVLAPALGIATAAGVAALVRQPGAIRFAGVAVGVALAAGVIASDRYVWGGAWNTPERRFEELAEIAGRFAGRGPILVNEREQYSVYFLRELDPWESWGTFQPRRGFRVGEVFPASLPHTPDFDDYTLQFLSRFRLLLERKGPAGSLPPSGFEPVYETAQYRVWQRRGAMPAAHVTLDQGRGTGSAPLDCADPRVRALFRRARATGAELLAARPGDVPRTLLRPADWRGWAVAPIPAPVRMINRWGGRAGTRRALPAGTYTAWIQGGFGPGVRLNVDGRPVGDVFGDLGLPDAWHRFGELTLRGGEHAFELSALAKPRWQSGWMQPDITGRLVLVRAGEQRTVTPVPTPRARSLCGERVDWLELRGAAQ